MQNKVVLEGLLFLSGDEGLTIEQICETLEIEENEAIDLMDSLMDEYLDESRGMEIVHFGGIFKFVSKEMIHPYARKTFFKY